MLGLRPLARCPPPVAKTDQRLARLARWTSLFSENERHAVCRNDASADKEWEASDPDFTSKQKRVHRWQRWQRWRDECTVQPRNGTYHNDDSYNADSPCVPAPSRGQFALVETSQALPGVTTYVTPSGACIEVDRHHPHISEVRLGSMQIISERLGSRATTTIIDANIDDREEVIFRRCLVDGLLMSQTGDGSSVARLVRKTSDEHVMPPQELICALDRFSGGSIVAASWADFTS